MSTGIPSLVSRVLLVFVTLAGISYSADVDQELNRLREKLKKQEERLVKLSQESGMRFENIPEDAFSKSNPYFRSLYLQYFREEEKYVENVQNTPNQDRDCKLESITYEFSLKALGAVKDLLAIGRPAQAEVIYLSLYELEQYPRSDGVIADIANAMLRYYCAVDDFQAAIAVYDRTYNLTRSAAIVDARLAMKEYLRKEGVQEVPDTPELILQLNDKQHY